jgi:hypothetical protein
MVSVPLLADPVVFPDAVKVTVPLPVPDAPVAIVSQLAFEAAVQPHVASAVTLTLPPPPMAGTDMLGGAIANVQDRAVWVTVNVFPPIVNRPVRAAPLLAATLKVTAPLPAPAAPPVTVTQFTFDVAVHAQPEAAAIVTVPVPPASLNV